MVKRRIVQHFYMWGGRFQHDVETYNVFVNKKRLQLDKFEVLASTVKENIEENLI